MAIRTFQATLQTSDFPHNFQELGDTVVVPTRFELNSGGEPNVSVPQAYFMQNVLPTSRGFSSVRYRNLLSSIPNATSPIKRVSTLRGAGDSIAMHADNDTQQFVYNPKTGVWQTFNLGILNSAGSFIATLKERSFIYIPGAATLFEYNFVTETLDALAVPALNLGNIKGFTAAGSYLIAWNDSQIFWSSVVDPLDFAPSLSTGAGATSILSVRGRIVTVVPLNDNFVIYTATNAVAAQLTRDIRFPFVFAEIPGAAGLISRFHVTANTEEAVHIAWTASGFQQVTTQQAQYAFPDLSDGIIRGILSELDPIELRPTLNRYQGLDVQVNFVSGRWVTISLRTKEDEELNQGFRIAYVLDVLLGRWGRLDVEHRNFVEFQAPEFKEFTTYAQLAADNPTYQDMAGKTYSSFAVEKNFSGAKAGSNFGVARSDGSIFSVSFSEVENFAPAALDLPVPVSRLFLGKYKVFRQSAANMQRVQTSGLVPGEAAVRFHAHAHDGKFVQSVNVSTEHPRQPGTFLGRLSGYAVSVELQGNFALNSLIVEAADAGKRNHKFFTQDSDFVQVVDGVSDVVNSDIIVTTEVQP